MFSVMRIHPPLETTWPPEQESIYAAVFKKYIIIISGTDFLGGNTFINQSD